MFTDLYGAHVYAYAPFSPCSHCVSLAQLGINHLGHFAFTAAVYPTLKKSTNGRVTNVSSSAKGFGTRKSIEDISNFEYSPWKTYGQSKLANFIFTDELDRLMKAANLPLSSVSLHPGVVQTELGCYMVSSDATTDAPLSERDNFSSNLLQKGVAFMLCPVNLGANTRVWLAAEQDLTTNGGASTRT